MQNSSASVLSAAGIFFGGTASTPEQYVATALRAYERGLTGTADRQRLARKFLTSPFCDGKAYIAKIETAIEDLLSIP
jgi:predicted O-linked N-acetylglucosamine transferase (SPINDLY family)